MKPPSPAPSGSCAVIAPGRLVGNERGAVLVLVLMILVTLAGLVGALLGPPASNLPGLSGAYGTFSVRIRNDCAPDDARVTGVSPDTTVGPCGAAAGTATYDANCRVIVAATG